MSLANLLNRGGALFLWGRAAAGAVALPFESAFGIKSRCGNAVCSLSIAAGKAELLAGQGSFTCCSRVGNLRIGRTGASGNQTAAVWAGSLLCNTGAGAEGLAAAVEDKDLSTSCLGFCFRNAN